MRSTILSLAVGLGVLGFALTTPTQAKADEHRGAAYTHHGSTAVAWGRRGWGYGRAYYPGWGGYGGYGYYRGYGYPYGGRGGYRSYYYPRYYGGYGVRPYGGWYGGYGYFW